VKKHTGKLWHDGGEGFDPRSTPDFLPLDRLRALQLDRLQAVVRRSYENVSRYRQKMEAKSITPDDITSLEDIRHLPFTEKDDLRKGYPYGMLASPLDEIVRLHASSGTTGKPTVVAYTEEDINLWAGVMARSFAASGIHEGDVLQNAYGYGLFTGGLGAHYGAEAVGAAVIPISGGNTDRQIQVMQDFGVTAICCTPSYFLYLLDRAREQNVSIRDLPLRVGVLGAEPWTREMAEHIEEEGGINAFDIYGLSEIIGPGVGCECEERSGVHIFEDHFYPEIVDPDTGEPLPDGEEGELVLTTLTKRAMPMIRYRTHDITSLSTEQCACGRTIGRISRISGRSDDMLIVRGVNVYPSQVEAALLDVEGTLPHYQIVLTRQDGLDEMEVQVEVTREVFSDRVGALEELQRRIASKLENALRIRVDVSLVEPRTIERSTGKATRVIDKRNE